MLRRVAIGEPITADTFNALIDAVNGIRINGGSGIRFVGDVFSGFTASATQRPKSASSTIRQDELLFAFKLRMVNVKTSNGGGEEGGEGEIKSETHMQVYAPPKSLYFADYAPDPPAHVVAEIFVPVGFEYASPGDYWIDIGVPANNAVAAVWVGDNKIGKVGFGFTHGGDHPGRYIGFYDENEKRIVQIHLGSVYLNNWIDAKWAFSHEGITS